MATNEQMAVLSKVDKVGVSDVIEGGWKQGAIHGGVLPLRTDVPPHLRVHVDHRRSIHKPRMAVGARTQE